MNLHHATARAHCTDPYPPRSGALGPALLGLRAAQRLEERVARLESEIEEETLWLAARFIERAESWTREAA